MSGVCSRCGEELKFQNKFIFKAFGNYCITCDGMSDSPMEGQDFVGLLRLF
jgi:hypothetical protein